MTCGSNTSQPFAKFKEAKGDIDAQLTSSSIDLEGLMQRGIIDSFDDTNWTISINFSPIANGTFSCSDDHRDSFDGVICKYWLPYYNLLNDYFVCFSFD